jgi:hypothetical protein
VERSSWIPARHHARAVRGWRDRPTRSLDGTAHHPAPRRDPEPLEEGVPGEFSAALLERRGLKVTLGPVGADGGVDVRAERDGDFGPELILVQTKHPNPGNKVTLETIKLLHYQVVTENATRGLVMTDSDLHPPCPTADRGLPVPDGGRRRRADPAVAPRAQNGCFRGRYADSALSPHPRLTPPRPAGRVQVVRLRSADVFGPERRRHPARERLAAPPRARSRGASVSGRGDQTLAEGR